MSAVLSRSIRSLLTVSNRGSFFLMADGVVVDVWCYSLGYRAAVVARAGDNDEIQTGSVSGLDMWLGCSRG
jgi:hypothetical protein